MLATHDHNGADRLWGGIAGGAARLLAGLYLSLALTALFQAMLAAYGRAEPGAALLRMPSWAYNTNVLAPMMIAGLLLAWHTRSYMLAVPCAVVFVLCLSLSSIIAAAVVGLIVMRDRRLMVALVIAGLVVLAVRWAGGYPWGDSIRYRLELWRLAWQAFREYPITGTGSGWYIFAHATGFVSTLWHYHNLYFQVLATTGIVGVLAFLTIAGVIGLAVPWSKRAALLLAFLAVEGIGDYIYWAPGVGAILIGTIALLSFPARPLVMSGQPLAVLILVGWLAYERFSLVGMTGIGALTFGLIFGGALALCFRPAAASPKLASRSMAALSWHH